MAIAFTNLGASSGGTATNPDTNNNADANSYATASWTPPTEGLILLAVYTTKATDLGSAPTVTGNGITWTLIRNIGNDPGAQTHRLTVYGALAAGATTGATTASYAGVTQSSCSMSFCQVTGVDLSGGVAGAIVQSPNNNATSGTSGSVTIAAAGNAANRPFGAFGHGQPEETNEDPNWQVLDQTWGSSPGHSLTTEYRDDAMDTALDGSWTTSGAWLGIALELKAVLGTDFTYTATDTLGLTDAISREVGKNKTLTDTLGFTDAISRVVDKVLTISDNLGLTDAVSRVITKALTISDTLGLTDTLVKARDLVRTISDNLGITDLINVVLTAAQNYAITISDTIGLTDTLSKARTLARTITDTLGLTDVMTAFFVYISRGTLRGARDLNNSLTGKRDKTGTLRGKKDLNNDLDGSI